MDRKKFLELAGISALLPTLGAKAQVYNTLSKSESELLAGWSEEVVKNRLYQGPFSVYNGDLAPGAVEGGSVVMTTTPSKRILKNFGMGLVTYVIDEFGSPDVPGESLAKSIEKLAQIPFSQKLYMRVNWKDLQQKPGELSLPEAWQLTFKMAKKYNKRIAFRVMLNNPHTPGLAIPDFLAQKVPQMKLGRTKELGGNASEKVQSVPEYANPVFQSAWKELDSLLSSKYNGSSLIEYMDTYMYGFWGGRTYMVLR